MGCSITFSQRPVPSSTPPDDGSGFPTLKHSANQPFLVNNIFTDFKRHDLGPNFYERMSVTCEISARLLSLGAGVARARQFNQPGEVVPRLIAVAGLRRRLPRAVQPAIAVRLALVLDVGCLAHER